MFFYTFVEGALMILAVVFVWTQMIVPAWRDIPAFPFFRKVFRRKKAAEDRMRELEATRNAMSVEKNAKQLEEELKGPKRGRKRLKTVE